MPKSRKSDKDRAETYMLKYTRVQQLYILARLHSGKAPALERCESHKIYNARRKRRSLSLDAEDRNGPVDVDILEKERTNRGERAEARPLN
jgi:hypothetical protein